MKIESFYGVRVKTVEALSKSHSPSAISILIEILLNEKEPLALCEMLHYCNIRDENLKNALIQILQRDPKYKIEQYLTNNLDENNVQSLPYLTVSRVLESLGFQRDPNFFSFFKSLTNDQGYLGIVCSGAHAAIASLRTIEAYNFLKNQVIYGNVREDSRSRIITLFANLSWWMNPECKQEAAEILIEILRGPDWGQPRILKAAILGLRKLELKKNFIFEALEAVKVRLAKQDEKFVDDTIKSLKKVGNENLSVKLKEEYEELSERLKKIEKKLLKKDKN
jgi:hypothetical protein